MGRKEEIVVVVNSSSGKKAENIDKNLLCSAFRQQQPTIW